MVSRNLSDWVSDLLPQLAPEHVPEMAMPSANDPQPVEVIPVMPSPPAEGIDLSSVTHAERGAALTGSAMALLGEARHYGVSIVVRCGHPRLSGKLPPEATETRFLHRLGESRRAVVIAVDSLARGWSVEWDEEYTEYRITPPRRTVTADVEPYVVDAPANRRPASWVDTEGKPVPEGSVCQCCRGTLWWREMMRPQGWRCWTCHPPTGSVPVTEQDTREGADGAPARIAS